MEKEIKTREEQIQQLEEHSRKFGCLASSVGAQDMRMGGVGISSIACPCELCSIRC